MPIDWVAHPADADPGQAVPHLPGPRRDACAVPRRRASGRTSTRARSTTAGTPHGRARWRGRRSSAWCRSDAELAPWADGVPHWDELDQTERRVAARFMETYAGFAEHADHHVGRLVDALRGARRPRRHAGLLPARRQRRLRRGRPERHVPRAPGRATASSDDTADMAARLDDRIGDPTTYADLPGRLGAGDEHAVPVDQAGRLALRRHPRRHDRALAARDRGPRRDPAPVAPRHRRAADHPRGRGAAAPRARRRRDAAAGRGHQHALHLRRPGRPGPPHHPVLRDGRQPRDLPRGLDRGDPARHPRG